MQVFEGVACTDSCGSFALLFLIMLAISLAGMIMVMLRAGMYPYKQVFPHSSLDDEEDELEEYRAYLQYVSPFLNMWGGNTDDNCDLSTKTGTYETSSESTSHTRPNTHTSMNLELAISATMNSNDFISEEALHPSALPKTPSFYNASDEAKSGTSFDDEKTKQLSPLGPLSSPNSNFVTDQSRIYTPDAQHTSDGDGDDEIMPLTHETSGIHSVGIMSRQLATSGFLTPATFRRWRRHDDETVRTGEELSETPLVISTNFQHEEGSSFSNLRGDSGCECTPLTPQTPGTHLSGMRSRRPNTPDFLTPGTFRGWRRRGKEDVQTGDELPETPLMISPEGQRNGVNYFSSFLSPLSRGRYQVDQGEDKSK
jgi:hypothetical protein